MENIDVLNLFQGIGTMVAGGWFLAIARVVLVIIGFLLIYLGWKGILEPMIMIPMGLGMIAINCGTLIMPDGSLGNLFLDPMLSDTDELMNVMQIDFLQPIYTLTFSNGLIACFVFYGDWDAIGCRVFAPEAFCQHISSLVCGTWDILDGADRVGYGVDVERECLRCHGRWS